jgi:ORF6N domain
VAQAKQLAVVPVQDITRAILVLRGQRVLLDAELATLYAVETRVLIQAVRRNLDRFPADFMFQLTAPEWAALRSQIVTLKAGRGQHRKYLPYVFTEQGVAMLSSVLRTKRAIAVNIQIMRAFVRMRGLLSSNRELARRFQQLEARLDKKLAEHDGAIAAILSAIRELMNSPQPKRRGIGFTADLTRSSRPPHRKDYARVVLQRAAPRLSCTHSKTTPN